MKLSILVPTLAALAACPFVVSRATATEPLPTAAPTPIEAHTYAIDGAHSGALFRIEHMGVAPFYGRFNRISGEYVLDTANPAACKVRVEIAADSVDSNSADRDNHIKSPDFFNAEEFPTIVFESKKVTAAGDKQYRVVGDLSFHGVTKEVTAEATLVGEAETPRGAKSGFEAKLTIHRSEFDVKTYPAPALGEDVQLIVYVEGNRK